MGAELKHCSLGSTLVESAAASLDRASIWRRQGCVLVRNVEREKETLAPLTCGEDDLPIGQMHLCSLGSMEPRMPTTKCDKLLV